MSNIISIANGEPSSLEINADLVMLLEKFLASAQAGDITSMAMAFTNADGSISTRWSGGDQCVTMLAAITMLQHEFAASVVGTT